MYRPQYDLNWSWADEMIVDLFAGGGGMSTAIHLATGISPHIACNHDADAISMHEANHPQTVHYHADVYELDPLAACAGRSVGLLHASPDCTHHSQAAGGQPCNRKIRSLSWVVKRWAAQVRPRVITLENVRQITKWGPLVAKRCKQSGRVMRRDGTVAGKGEVVPLSDQYLVPDPKRMGRTWRQFVSSLEALGYVVEWRLLCAADYGAPTTRERLFMVARCDGQPIVWPQATHGKKARHGQKRWRSAAECIDWSIPGKSIFDRDKPLAEATLRRIAKGIQKFVLDNPAPFVVKFKGDSPGCPLDESLSTIARGGHALTAAYLMQANDGFNATFGRAMDTPVSTITNSGSQQQLVGACLIRQSDSSSGSHMADPVGTVLTGGDGGKTPTAMSGLGVVRYASGIVRERVLRVAAFLVNYYGNGDARDLDAPMDTLTTRDRLALVTVHLDGEPYYITDITLRMLDPHELYKAQGFPPDYIITRGHDGRRFSKTAQVRMCGNSVSPPPAAALLKANYRHQFCFAEAV